MNEPQLYPGDYFYLKAWSDLNSCRSMGMSRGPIPWKDIILYAEYSQLEYDLIEPFVLIIRTMDSAYIDWVENEEERKRTK